MSGKKAIRYLSIAVKAGALTSGFEECQKKLRRGGRGLLALACDAGANTVRRAQALAGAAGIRLLPCIYTKSELARAIGRGSPVSLILVTDEGLAGAFAAAHATEQEERI